MTNHLHYGDNLTVLRESIAYEIVDLIYLDPPFNSNATYNVLFKAPDGHLSGADRGVRRHLALERQRRVRLRRCAALPATPTPPRC